MANTHSALPKRLRPAKRAFIAVAATATIAGAALAAAPAALAFGPSFCNASSCLLSTSPSTAGAYFEMPQGTPVTMLCWTDNQWWDGTNRWFKTSSIYGIGFMNADQVSNQTRVGNC